jgi:hypothetical protein
MLARSQHCCQGRSPDSLDLGEVQDVLDPGMYLLFHGVAEPTVLMLAQIHASVA